MAAYRLGFHVGYCSNVLGSVALSPPEAQAKVREILAPRIQGMQDLGQALGVGEVSLLPVSNIDEFGRVNDSLDTDELGLAARVEKAHPGATGTCCCSACTSGWPPRWPT